MRKLALRARRVRVLAALLIPTAVAAPALAVTAGATAPPPTLPVAIADRTLDYGQALQARGHAPAGDAGHRVALRYRVPGGPWATMATARVAPNGAFRLRAVVHRSGQAQVVLASGATGVASVAAAGTPRPVTVGALLRPTVRRLDVLAGQVAAVRGRIAPGIAGRTVTLQALGRGGWHTVARARTGRGGAWRLAFRPAHNGSLTVRVRFGGDRLNAPAATRLGRLDVYRHSRASWYLLAGGPLACGGTMTAETMGVANKTLPCGTMVTIRYGGREVRVPVVDRGPYAAGVDYDLSAAVAHRLHFDGVQDVLATR